MSEAIVSFRSPPVVEVVVGVALRGLGAEATALLGAFWKDELRPQFPSLQQQPAYEPPIEQFPATSGAMGFSLRFGGAFPGGRLWATSTDEQEVVQLQPDWFACNWRKVQPGGNYDRWSGRRDAFSTWFSKLFRYLAAEGVPEPDVVQCEVTYVNHVLAGETWQEHAQLDRIFRLPTDLRTPYALEQLSAQAQFVLTGDTGPYGRLHVKVLPAYDRAGAPMYVFELLARGASRTPGLEGALLFLDSGREAIDRAFTALTTSAMHREWGLIEP